MSTVTAQQLYEEYKRMMYTAANALAALQQSYAAEETIEQARRALDFYSSLANVWGCVNRRGMSEVNDFEGDFYDE